MSSDNTKIFKCIILALSTLLYDCSFTAIVRSVITIKKAGKEAFYDICLDAFFLFILSVKIMSRTCDVDEEGNITIFYLLFSLSLTSHIITRFPFQVDNFIHADMHPGNILVRVTQSKSSRKRIFKSKPHVVFLDVGMTAELTNNDRIILLEFFKAIARRDGQTVAECTLQLSKKQNCPNPEAFIKVYFHAS